MSDSDILFEVHECKPCAICGETVHYEFSVQNELWNLVMRPDGKETDNEYICLSCFFKRATLSVLSQSQKLSHSHNAEMTETNWDELINAIIYSNSIKITSKAVTQLRSAIGKLEKERDNLKTVLHGNQDADYDKQLQIETLKEQLSAYKAKEENASQLSGIRNWDITNWRDHFARIPQEEQTGEDLFLQKCLDAIDKLHWSLDECMRQYDIQQERACDAETKLAAAENDAGMLANVYFFWDDYSSCFRCVHCKHVDYEGHSDDCPIELHRTRLAGKEGE